MARLSRKSNSKLSALIARLQRVHQKADQTGMPIDELYDMDIEQEKHARLHSTHSRRQFLKSLGAGAAATAAASPFGASATIGGNANNPGSVAIIGGGLAGLRCAHRLWQYGHASKVFEASNRVGGRAFTTHGYFSEAPSVERGGELVSTEHSALRNLCHQLGLSLEDVNGGATANGEELYYSSGQLVTESQLNDAWRDIYRTFKFTEKDAPWQPIYSNFNQEHVRLDNINVPDWLDDIGVGASSPVGGILQADVISEYGLAPEEQSALNLLYLLAWNPINTALPLAGTDERFHIVGGSEGVATAMHNELPAGTVELDKALVAIQGTALGPYTCVFDDGSSYVADQLVLTLPFTTLRDVDIAPAIWASFIPEKRQAINELQMGDNAKIHIETLSRPWQQTRIVNGESVTTNTVSYSDANGFVTVWDTQSANTAAPGTVYCNYLGGHQGRNLNTPVPFGVANNGDVNDFISEIENVFPGTAAAYSGNALVSKWTIHPWAKGSYAAPAIGHYTSWWGGQWQTEMGNKIYFAGEHISEEYWGFMNGAIETGEKAAFMLTHG